MIDVARRCYRLVAPDGRARWGLVVLLAVLVSGVEATGALVVFALLSMVAGDGVAMELPVLGELGELLPGWDETTLLVAACLFITAFFVLRGGLLVSMAYAEHHVTEQAGARLASRLVATYLGAPYAWHLRRNSAELIRNAHESVQIIVSDALRPMVKLISEGVLALGIVAVLVITSPLATLLAVVLLTPVIAVVMRAIQPRSKRLGGTNQKKVADTLQALQQSLHGLRDIKVLGREGYFHHRFVEDRRRPAHVRTWRHTLRAVPRAIVETVLVLFIAGFFAITVVMQGSGAEALPILGVFAYAGFRLKQPINELTAAMNKLRFAGAALRDVERDLRAAPAARAQADGEAHPATAAPFRSELMLRHVSFRYDGADAAALRDVTLSIAPGESVGLVGPTGGGKSTLVDLVIGLLEPTAGAVLVDGVDLRGRTRAWQRNVGVVAQSTFLIDDTLRGNIALGVAEDAIDEQALWRAIGMAQLDDVVASLPQGWHTTVGERGVRLSGGQRQRVAIARALYRDPAVLVLDEGTSALDNQTEAALLDRLAALRGSCTLLTVAHRLTTVRSCDRIYVVADGEIEAVGTYAQLSRTSTVFQQARGRPEARLPAS